jgi:hypothetical protein
MQAISDTECSLVKKRPLEQRIPILIAKKFRRSLKALQVQGSGVSLLPIKERNKNNYSSSVKSINNNNNNEIKNRRSGHYSVYRLSRAINTSMTHYSTDSNLKGMR